MTSNPAPAAATAHSTTSAATSDCPIRAMILGISSRPVQSLYGIATATEYQRMIAPDHVQIDDLADGQEMVAQFDLWTVF